MDEAADAAIANWSWASLAANLLPPPFDSIAVTATFAKMGARLAEIYDVPVSKAAMKNLGASTAKGIGSVIASASKGVGAGSVVVSSYVGIGLLKYVPGVNIWVALLIQPPLVAAVSYSIGSAFKRYYHVRITEGRDLSGDEVCQLVVSYLREKLSGSIPRIATVSAR
jgi:hypothetical protein